MNFANHPFVAVLAGLVVLAVVECVLSVVKAWWTRPGPEFPSNQWMVENGGHEEYYRRMGRECLICGGACRDPEGHRRIRSKG